MPEYKLIYFNARGRAEITRWIFAYADIPYTDERIEKEDWPARKSTMPGGKMPVLMVDGTPLTQSLAIARYVAKMAGLVPEDPFEAAQCDSMVDSINDMMAEVFKVMFMPGSKEEQEKKMKEEVFPNVVLPILKQLEERFTSKAYYVSDKITWVDLLISLVVSGMRKKKEELIKPFPKLEAHVDKILANPKIKAWNDKQPELPF